MSTRETIKQLPGKLPTMWDSSAREASLVGQLVSGYTFAHATGAKACTFIVRRLGNPGDRP